MDNLTENLDEVVAFGKTRREINEMSKAILGRTIVNHPTSSSSYADFLLVKNKGHKELLAQENYGKS
jgi:hypothetical protein